VAGRGPLVDAAPAAAPLLRGGAGGRPRPHRLPHRPRPALVPAAGIATMYVELHAHSAFSFLDGASTPLELAAAAAAQGYPAFALTDHDGLWGSMEFAHACRGFGTRAIAGAELTVRSGPAGPVAAGDPPPPAWQEGVPPTTPPTGQRRMLLLFLLGFAVVTAASLAWPAINPGLKTFYDRTVGIQAGRDSPFSIWGQLTGTTARCSAGSDRSSFSAPRSRPAPEVRSAACCPFGCSADPPPADAASLVLPIHRLVLPTVPRSHKCDRKGTRYPSERLVLLGRAAHGPPHSRPTRAS